MTKPLTERLNEAVKELAEAQESYTQIERVLQAARTQETTAINRVNEAQKTVDILMTELKKTAPYNSDWKAKR